MHIETNATLPPFVLLKILINKYTRDENGLGGALTENIMKGVLKKRLPEGLLLLQWGSCFHRGLKKRKILIADILKLKDLYSLSILDY